jgi:hypothetical protein
MAIGLLVLLVAVALVMVAKKSPKQVLTWGLGGTVVGGVVSAIGILPLFGLAGPGIGLGLGAAIGLARSFRHAAAKPQKTAFDATHAHDNVAINEHRNLLWARDEQGREYTLEAREIRQWNHLWVPDKGYKAHNRIELRTTRLDTPVIVVPFRRHSATIWGAPKNAQECEEWHGRLSAFLDRSPR